MGEIDRRALIGAGGATVALAACSPAGKSSDKNDVNGSAIDADSLRDWKVKNSPFGPGIPNDDAGIQKPNNGKRRIPRGAKKDDFKAEYFCLVYIKFSDGKIDVRHAYFYPTINVKDQFVLVSSGESWARPFGGNEYTNFDNFNFGSPQTIYMYIDNDTVEFDPENLIQMTFFGPRKDKPGNPKIKDVNNAFLNPEIDIVTWQGKKLLKIENWFYGKNGRKIDKTKKNEWEYFSMNIHILMKTASGGGAYGDIPLVIDPDGGNMGSQP
jgi:hypothetical protein